MRRHYHEYILIATLALSLTACVKPHVPAESSSKDIVSSDVTGEEITVSQRPRKTPEPHRQQHTDTHISLPAGVSPRMSEASFWIDRHNNPHRVLKSYREIKEFNRNNPQEIICESGRSISMDSIPDTITGDFLKELMLSAYKFGEKATYIDGKKTPASYQSEMEEKLGLEKVAENIRVKFGYSVEYTTMRSYPCDDYVYEASYPQFDRMLRSDIHPYKPVVILWESRDGRWEYILYGSCGGWVKKDTVAFCHDRNEWEKRKECDNFLVVTGKEFRTQTDINCNGVSDKTLPMGTVLPLADGVKNVRGRTGYGCYTVCVPTRGTDGYIKDEYMFVPAGEDVNFGYLDFTYANTVTQAFKYQGNIYGYGGNLNSVDCSGLVRNVFACFGFDMPRTASFQVDMEGARKENIKGRKDSEKTALFQSTDGVRLIYLPGHIMIYLGNRDGDDYVISSTYGFGEDSKNVIISASVTLTDMQRTYKADGTSWLGLSSRTIEFT